MSLFTGATLLGVALASAGSSVAAAKINSSGQKDAANAALTGTQQGLDFLKAQKAKQEAAAVPYQNLGSLATQHLAGAVRPSPVGGPPMPYSTQPQATMPSAPMSSFGAPQMPQMPSPGGMVTLQAPDGSQKQVPQAQAQYFIQRGAKLV